MLGRYGARLGMCVLGCILVDALGRVVTQEEKGESIHIPKARWSRATLPLFSSSRLPNCLRNFFTAPSFSGLLCCSVVLVLGLVKGSLCRVVCADF